MENNKSISTVVQDVERGYAEGMRFILAEWCSKNPGSFEGAGWQNKRHPLGYITAQLNLAEQGHKRNICLLNGEPSNGHIDIDLDDLYAVKLAPKFLKPTRTFGRATKRKSHYIYRIIDEVPKTVQYEDSDYGMLVECRSTRTQTVYPGSCHPSGEAIEWDSDSAEKITEIISEELLKDVSRLGAATLYANHYPAKGSRQNATMALAGVFARAGWDVEDAIFFVEEVSAVADDDLEDLEKRRDAVRRTFEKIESGEQDITGFPTLAKIIGESVAKTFCKWLCVDRKAQGFDPHKDASSEGLVETNEATPVEKRCTDVGNAARFARQHSQVVRYCHEIGQWLGFDGKLWRTDKTGEVMRLARKTVQGIYHEAALAPEGNEMKKKLALHAVRSESEPKLAAMVSLARSEAELVIASDVLDQDPYLFNCENGTVDLRAGTIREHSPDDFITNISPVVYDPNAKAERWEQFLNEIFNGDVELIRFVHRAVGYSLTGLTSEQCFFLLHGSGSNGKSVFLKILMTLMNSYGAHTAADALMLKKFDGSATPEVAKLRGARFVSASETEDGHKLAEAKIKQLTGGDPVTCRFLNQNPFTYVPAYKIWLATNHKPKVNGTDYAIWRRVKLIPFNVRFEGDRKDPNLENKLLAELPGILTWAVRGAVDWYSQGLGDCKAVEAATEEYRAESDSLASFLAEECTTGEGLKVKASELREEYEIWCKEIGEAALTPREFNKAMKERSFVYKQDRILNKYGITESTKCWTGVKSNRPALSFGSNLPSSSMEEGGTNGKIIPFSIHQAA